MALLESDNFLFHAPWMKHDIHVSWIQPPWFHKIHYIRHFNIYCDRWHGKILLSGAGSMKGVLTGLRSRISLHSSLNFSYQWFIIMPYSSSISHRDRKNCSNNFHWYLPYTKGQKYNRTQMSWPGRPRQDAKSWPGRPNSDVWVRTSWPGHHVLTQRWAGRPETFWPGHHVRRLRWAGQDVLVRTLRPVSDK